MVWKQWRIVCAGLLMWSTQLMAAQAGTLQAIERKSVITLGVTDHSVPFSYVGDKLQYQGYAVDLCNKVVDGVRTALGKEIRARYVHVTAATWLEALKNNQVDIVCDGVTNNVERAAHVGFSVTHFVATGRILSRKDAPVTQLSDLSGKPVAVVAGTTNANWLIARNKAEALNLKILQATSHSEAFNMVATKRAAAFVTDDVLLAGLLSRARNAQDFVVGKEALSVEPYGLMMRKDDAAFKSVVDKALVATYQSGEIGKIYATWFTSPVPPQGENLNLPMSSQVRAIFKTPTDSPDPARYPLQK